MSAGSNICRFGGRRHRIAAGGRNRLRLVHRGAPARVCPFTLEATRDCAMRKRSPRTPCLFSLEFCPASP